jgi:hypothetical protein
MAKSSGRCKVFPVLLLLLLYHEVSGTGFRKKRRSGEPSEAFTAHTVVAPKVFHSRPKRDIASTAGNSSTGEGLPSRHADRLALALETDDGRPLVLDLVLNRQLIPQNYFQSTHQQVSPDYTV